jgi:hypothetical protein
MTASTLESRRASKWTKSVSMSKQPRKGCRVRGGQTLLAHEGHRHHDQGQAVMPGKPAAGRCLVQPGAALAILESAFDPEVLTLVSAPAAPPGCPTSHDCR